MVVTSTRGSLLSVTDRTAILQEPVDFDNECHDGRCKEPYGAIFNCGVHQCLQKCLQLHDHSKMACEHVLNATCSKGHVRRWKCYSAPPVACPKCEQEAKDLERKMNKAFEDQRRRDREAQEHARKMANLQDQMDVATQNFRDKQVEKEGTQAIQQKQKDVAAVLAMAKQAPAVNVQPRKNRDDRTAASDPQPNLKTPLAHAEISKLIDSQPLKPEGKSPAALEW